MDVTLRKFLHESEFSSFAYGFLKKHEKNGEKNQISQNRSHTNEDYKHKKSKQFQ